jgi:hypothetical protein
MEVVMAARITYLLQFCGVSDPLQLFYLEQRSVEVPGPVFTGLRPFQLDSLMAWALDSARGRGWDLERIQATVVDVWLERRGDPPMATAPAAGTGRSPVGGGPGHPARLGAALRGDVAGLSAG